MKTFRRELMGLINKHSKENGSDTPDYILADYLIECLNNFNKTIKNRNYWYGINAIEEKILEANKQLINAKFELTTEQTIKDNVIDYNNLCARATLYPGKTIEEVSEVQFEQHLNDSFNFINSVLLGTIPMNNKETREWVTKTLEGRLRKYGVVVICSANNNTSEVIDKCQLVARVVRAYNKAGVEKYTDLVFGENNICED